LILSRLKTSKGGQRRLAFGRNTKMF